MRNIIKDVAAKNAVPWGEIAEKIDENFSEVDANFVKGIKVNGHTLTRKNEEGVIDIGNLTDIYIIPYFTMADLENLLNGGDEISYDFGSLIEAARSQKTLCVWDSTNHNGLSVASLGLLRTLEIIGTRYYSLDLVSEGILNRSMIHVTDLIKVGKLSPYITNFSLTDAISGEEVMVSRALLDAAYLGAPVIIKDKNSLSYLTSTLIHADNPNETTYLYLEASDSRQKYRLTFDSHEIIPENGSISIVPEVRIIPAELSIVSITGARAQSVDNVMRLPSGLFSDKSVEYSKDNAPEVHILISNQITILEVPLLGDGLFMFPAPPRGTAVEYVVKFRVNTPCSWNIATTEGNRIYGHLFGLPLSNITVGTYLMKITLFTYTDTKGNPVTEYISEMIRSTK